MNQLAPKHRRRSQLKAPWRFFEGREQIHSSKTRHEFGLPASSNRYRSSPGKRLAQRQPLWPGAKNHEPSEDWPQDCRANMKSGRPQFSFVYQRAVFAAQDCLTNDVVILSEAPAKP